jgi:hypothetical protein
MSGAGEAAGEPIPTPAGETFATRPDLLGGAAEGPIPASAGETLAAAPATWPGLPRKRWVIAS